MESVTVHDSDQVSEISKAEGWEVDYVQLEAGQFEGHFARWPLHQLAVHQEHHDRHLEVLGTIRRGVEPFALVLSGRSPGRFQGRPCAPGDLAQMRSGGECDFVLSKNLELLIIHVPEDVLLRTGAAFDGDDAGNQRPVEPVVRLEPARAAHLAWLLRQARDEAHACPTLFKEEIQSRVLSLLWQATRRSNTARGADSPAMPQRARHARHVIEILNEHLESPVTVEALAAASGICPRTLQLSFREVFQISPMAYLRARRLHAAKKLLRISEPGEVSVTDVAMRFGFEHLGRFSGYYKSMFGESPAQTLRV